MELLQIIGIILITMFWLGLGLWVGYRVGFHNGSLKERTKIDKLRGL